MTSKLSVQHPYTGRNKQQKSFSSVHNTYLRDIDFQSSQLLVLQQVQLAGGWPRLCDGRSLTGDTVASRSCTQHCGTRNCAEIGREGIYFCIHFCTRRCKCCMTYVVYFNQRTGATQAVCWLKSIF